MNIQPACLTGETLMRIRRNEISNPEWSDLEEHLTHCADCRSRLESGEKDPDWTQEILPALAAEEESPLALLDPETCESDQEAGSLDQVLRLLGPTDNPHMLGRIGQYEVVGVVGRGGMGVVFKAFEPSLNRMVAIKMLLPHLAASPAARKRFAREGKAAAAVIDDHVMPIHGVSEWQGTPYLVMRYSPGPNLQKRVEKQGPLELEEILRIGTQTAKGLAAAHAQGLVHRDVKPSNILLDGTVERAMLTDFGLARAADDATLTRSGVLAGTPQYMSPEQVKGEQVDSRADLFGLGCVLYTLCTGKPPFEGENSYAILRQITDGAPRPIREVNPRIPSWLSNLVGRLMAKQPEKRPGSAEEVAEMLEGALAHVQQPETTLMPASLVSPLFTKSRFNRLGTGVLLMIATLFVGFGMLWLAQTEPSDIAGTWDGSEWGSVVLRKTGANSWEGSYAETSGKEPGKIALQWSRIERRFNGTWNEGMDARFGELSLRLVDDSLVGAYTTDIKSRINPGTPKLADLRWKKAGQPGGTGGSPNPGAMAEKDKQIKYLDQRVDKLKEIGKAIHNYEATYGFLPPGNVRDANGKVLYSWRVLLLPYLGEHEIYNQWKLDQAWDSPANKPLSDKVIKAYADPEKPTNQTRFKVFVGDNTAWIPGPPGWNQSGHASPKLIRFTSILDGTSNTLAAVEGRFEIPWAAPQDFDYNQAFLTSEIFPIENKVLALMLDGSYRTLSNSLAKEVWNQLIVRNDVTQGITANPAPKASISAGSSGMGVGAPGGAGDRMRGAGLAPSNPPPLGFHGQNPNQLRVFHEVLTKSMGLPLKLTLDNEGTGMLTGEGNFDFPWTAVGKSILGVMELPATPTTAEEKKLARQRRLELLSNLISAVADQTRTQAGGIPWPGQKEAEAKKIHPLAKTQAEASAKAMLGGSKDLAPLYHQRLIRGEAAKVAEQVRALLKPLGQDIQIEVETGTNSLVTRNFMGVQLAKLLDSKKTDGGTGIFEERLEAILARLQVLETLKILVENQDEPVAKPGSASSSANPDPKAAFVENTGLPETLYLKYCPPEIGLTILFEWGKVTGQDLVVPVTRDNGFGFGPVKATTEWKHFSRDLLNLADGQFQRENAGAAGEEWKKSNAAETNASLQHLRESMGKNLFEAILAFHKPVDPAKNPLNRGDLTQEAIDTFGTLQTNAKDLAKTLLRQDKDNATPPDSHLALDNIKPLEAVPKLRLLLKPFGLQPVTRAGSVPNEISYKNTTQGNLEVNLLLLANDPRKDSELNPEDLKIRWQRRMNVVELLGVIKDSVHEKPPGIDPLAKPGENKEQGFLPENLKLKYCPPEIGLTMLAEWSKVTGQDLMVPITRDNGFRLAQGTGQSSEKNLSYILLLLADEIYKVDKNRDLENKTKGELQEKTKQALTLLRISLEKSLAATFQSRPFPGTKSETAREDTAIKQRTIQQIKNSSKNYAHFWVNRSKNWFASSSPGTLQIPRDGTPEDCVFQLKALLKPFGQEPLTKVSDRQNPRSVVNYNTACGNLDNILFQLDSDPRKDPDLTWEELKERWSLRMNALELLEGIVTGSTKNLQDSGIDPGISRSKALDKLTQEKLARIGKALLDYHQKNGHLPPSQVLDKEGFPLYSWRVLLLPYIGEDELFKRWKLDEPWDSPHNKPLSDIVVDLYCEAGRAGTNKTPFRVFTGNKGLFDGNRLESLKKEGRTLKDVNDTLARTILVIESALDGPWAEPKEIPTDNNEDLVELGNYQEGVIRILWADGITSSIPRSTRKDYLLMLASPNGGEVVPGFYEAPAKP